MAVVAGERAVLRMGRHRQRRTGPAHRAPRRYGLCAWVDLTTLIEHLLTPDAAAAGRLGGGRYIALCGADVIPASMVEPGRGFCQPCRVALILAQRSRGSRR